MQKIVGLLAGTLVIALATNVNADTFEKCVSVGAIAGTTGFDVGGDVS